MHKFSFNKEIVLSRLAEVSRLLRAVTASLSLVINLIGPVCYDSWEQYEFFMMDVIISCRRSQ